MKLHAVGITDIGNIRPENQDAFTVQTAHGSERGNSLLAVVADGVGGGKAGNVASQLAVETLTELFLGGAWDEQDAMASAIETANARILERSGQDELCRGMATTCTALVIKGESAVIGHVGDSRAYRIRDGEILQLTEDHTLPRRLFREGLITEEEVYLHPQSNVLTNAIGSRGKIEIELVPAEVRERDIFVLCSDGMHKYFKDEEIREIVARAGAQTSAEKFVAAAKERGGDDNITVVVVRADGDGLGKTTEITATYEEPAKLVRKSGAGWKLALFIVLLVGTIAFVVKRYH